MEKGKAGLDGSVSFYNMEKREIYFNLYNEKALNYYIIARAMKRKSGQMEGKNKMEMSRRELWNLIVAFISLGLIIQYLFCFIALKAVEKH